MERSVELEVDAAGQVTWSEGTLELGPTIAARIATLEPQSIVYLKGQYSRPDRDTKILRITQLTGAIRPFERAKRAWQRDELAQFRTAIEREDSAMGHALQAVLAMREGRRDDAHAQFCEALRREPVQEEGPPLARVWAAMGPIDVPTELEDALIELVWCSLGGWAGWADPIVTAAHAGVVPRDRVRPYQFSGPRVEPFRGLVAEWLVARAEQLATPVEGVGIAELRAMSRSEQRAWLRGSERRDQRAEDAAYREVLRNHPRDSMDSPPDSADPGLLERDQLLLAWLRYQCSADTDRIERFAGDLVGAVHKFVAPEAARALALAIDAVVILSALAPAIAHEVDQVVFARVAWRGGFGIVRAGDTHVMLHAPHGPFGAFELIDGDAILDAVPAELQPRVRAALARRDACEVVLDRVAPARHREPSPRQPRLEEPQPPPADRFVTHPKFGRGRVVATHGKGTETKLEIEFPGVGTKLLLERFVTPAE